MADHFESTLHKNIHRSSYMLYGTQILPVLICASEEISYGKQRYVKFDYINASCFICIGTLASEIILGQNACMVMLHGM